MPFNRREVERALTGKFGFVPTAGRESGHHWYRLDLPGIPEPIETKLSHSRAEIHNKLAGKMARQLRVRGHFFEGMIRCTRSKDDYERQIRDDPYPPWDVRF